MKTKVLLISLLLVLSLGMEIARADERVFAKESSFKPFENMMKEKAQLYKLYEEGNFKVYNKEIKFDEDNTFTLNGIMADKATVFIMYTLVGDMEYHEVNVSSKNFRTYLDKNKTGAHSAGLRHFKDKDKTYVILSCDVQLVPDWNDKINLSIDYDKIWTRSMTISFGEEDFMRSSVDFAPNIELKGFGGKVDLDRVVSSPLGIILFVKYTEEGSNNSLKEVEFKRSTLIANEKELKCYGGGGTRISDKIFYDHATYAPAPEDTREITFNTNGYSYNIKLPLIPTRKYPKNAFEFGSCIDSDRIIFLEDKEYNLGNIIYETDKVQRNFIGNGKEIIIQNVENLTIIGKENTRIIVENNDANVLTFKNCKNIKMKNLTIGHTKEEENTIGKSIKLLDSEEVSVKNCKVHSYTNTLKISDNYNRAH